MHLPRLLPLLLLAGLAAPAHADIYKCTDTDGRVTYTNDRSLGRSCVRLQSARRRPAGLPPHRPPSPPRLPPRPAPSRA